eukprot:730602-Amphidinium_carterae.1
MHRAWQHAERHTRQLKVPLNTYGTQCPVWDGRRTQLAFGKRRMAELHRAAMGVACRALASERSDFQGARMMCKELHRSVTARLSQQARNEYSFHLSGGGPSWHEHAARLSKATDCPLCGGSPCTWHHSLWECAGAHAHREEELMSKCRQLKAPPCFLQRGLIEESLDWLAADLTGARARKEFCLRFITTLIQRKAQWLRVIEGRLDALPIIPSAVPVRSKRATSVPLLPTQVEAARYADINAVATHIWNSKVEHRQTVWWCTICDRHANSVTKARHDLAGCPGVQQAKTEKVVETLMRRRAWQLHAERAQMSEEERNRAHDLVDLQQ